MTLWRWSRTAAPNANADATINWAEGQPPSSVNDSARAMMAAAAKYRDDIAGAIPAGGTGSAYTVTSYQTFDTLAHLDGAMIAFTPQIGNGSPVTLNVDGLGAKPLRAAPNVELPTGALVTGTPYVTTYNNADGAFYLQGGLSNPYNIPLGGLLPYIGASAPNSSFALPFGQAISRTTYGTLFSLIGTTFGSGDGSTTFNLPDIRGRVVAGLDNMGTSGSANRLSAVMSSQTMGGTGGSQTQSIAQANLPNITLTTNINDPGHSHSVNGSSPFGVIPAAVGGAFTALQATGGSGISGLGVALTAGTGITASTPLGGSGNALITTAPTIVANYILRII